MSIRIRGLSPSMRRRLSEPLPKDKQPLLLLLRSLLHYHLATSFLALTRSSRNQKLRRILHLAQKGEYSLLKESFLALTVYARGSYRHTMRLKAACRIHSNLELKAKVIGWNKIKLAALSGFFDGWVQKRKCIMKNKLHAVYLGRLTVAFHKMKTCRKKRMRKIEQIKIISKRKINILLAQAFETLRYSWITAKEREEREIESLRRVKELNSLVQERKAKVNELNKQLKVKRNHSTLEIPAPDTSNRAGAFGFLEIISEGRLERTSVDSRPICSKSNPRSCSRERRTLKKKSTLSQKAQEDNLSQQMHNSFSSIDSFNSRLTVEERGEKKGSCNCTYYTDYQKAKSQINSLKRQIEIVNKELLISKDLQDYFINELSSSAKFSNFEEKSQEAIKKLKNAIQEAEAEREEAKSSIAVLDQKIKNIIQGFTQRMKEIHRQVRKQY